MECILREPELAEIVHGLYSDDVMDELSAIAKFRDWWSDEEDKLLISRVVETGIITRLVEFLRMKGNIALQVAAAYTIINITSGTSEQTKSIIDAGAVPILIQLLKSRDHELQEYSLWVLGNIAGDCPEYRDFVLDRGIMGPLLQLLYKMKQLPIIKDITWVVRNLCRGRTSCPNFYKISHCLPALSNLLYHLDCDVLTHVCWSFAYLCDGSVDKIQAVIDVGVCRRLVDLLLHPSRSVAAAALIAVGNIAMGDDSQTQVILDYAALPNLLHLLKSGEQPMREESCRALSNITAGNVKQIQAVFDANIIPVLIKIMDTDANNVKKEAAWALANVTIGGSSDQIRYIVDEDCIFSLCDLLLLKDFVIIEVALNALDNILRRGKKIAKITNELNSYALRITYCFGLERIKCLQNCENFEIREKASEIVENYFDWADDIIECLQIGSPMYSDCDDSMDSQSD